MLYDIEQLPDYFNIGHFQALKQIGWHFNRTGPVIEVGVSETENCIHKIHRNYYEDLVKEGLAQHIFDTVNNIKTPEFYSIKKQTWFDQLFSRALILLKVKFSCYFFTEKGFELWKEMGGLKYTPSILERTREKLAVDDMIRNYIVVNKKKHKLNSFSESDKQ